MAFTADSSPSGIAWRFVPAYAVFIASMGDVFATRCIRMRCEKGKPAARRGRKAYGPPMYVWEIAGLPTERRGPPPPPLLGGGREKPRPNKTILPHSQSGP